MKQIVPNLLTYSRIVVIPLFVAAFYMEDAWRWVPLILFIYASITDFLDGYLARKWNVISDIGRVLDPIADKLLVAAALIMLMNVKLIMGPMVIAVMIILLRELFVSGLREALENKRITIHVSKLGKWKTATQMVAIAGYLILYTREFISGLLISGSMILFVVAALLTLITGIEYTVKGFRALKAKG